MIPGQRARTETAMGADAKPCRALRDL